MALDEPKDGDARIDEDHYSIVVARDVLERVGGVKIDYRSTWRGPGFTIRPTFGLGSCSC